MDIFRKEVPIWNAKIYRRYRRDAPAQLGDKIISHLKEKYDGPLDRAADVACGSGQSTVLLAPFFRKVHGLDISEAQIQESRMTHARPNVTYEVSPAECLPFRDKSLQLVTAGAALHWFQLEDFFQEVRRVLCNNGVLAVYIYYTINPFLNDPTQTMRVEELNSEVFKFLEPFFAPQVATALEKYKNVNFPFEEVIRMPGVRDTFEGQLSDIVGYFSSFSAVEYLRSKNEKMADEFLSNFQQRLEKIVTACNIPVNGIIPLYSDYLLILCRKIEKGV